MPNPFALLLAEDSDDDDSNTPTVPAPALPKSTLKMPPAYVPLMTPPESLTPSREKGKGKGLKSKKEDGASTPAPPPSKADPEPGAAEPSDITPPAEAPAEQQQKRLCILRGLPGR